MVIILFLPPLVVIGAVVAAVLRHRYGRVEPRRLTRGLALGLAVTYAAFTGLFIVAETADDPGGAVALAQVAPWAVPMAVLCLVPGALALLAAGEGGVASATVAGSPPVLVGALFLAAALLRPSRAGGDAGAVPAATAS